MISGKQAMARQKCRQYLSQVWGLLRSYPMNKAMFEAYLALHSRRNFLYMGGGHRRQFQQVLHSCNRPAARLLHKRILRPNVRPIRRQIRRHLLGVKIKYPHLAPAPFTIHQFQPPAQPRVKGVRDG